MKNNILFLATALLFSNISLLQGMENTKETPEDKTRISIFAPNTQFKGTTTATWQCPLTISLTALLLDHATTALLVTYNNRNQYAGLAQYPLEDNKQEHAVHTLCSKALKKQNKRKKIVTANFFFATSEKLNNYLYKKLINIVADTLHEVTTIKTHYVSYDVINFLSCNNDQKQNDDLEIILYPDKATIKIRGHEPKDV